ncbi:MAG: hypothetical protein NXY57DRAFT_1042038 [Lentinula lateritia]|nr:MAG: hypothetical protein NXY57DRAFT_1042038 [Lentinula lateritia]
MGEQGKVVEQAAQEEQQADKEISVDEIGVEAICKSSTSEQVRRQSKAAIYIRHVGHTEDEGSNTTTQKHTALRDKDAHDAGGRGELISIEGNFAGEAAGRITEGVFWGEGYDRGAELSIEERYTTMLTANGAYLGAGGTRSEERVDGVVPREMMLEGWEDTTVWGGQVGYVNNDREVGGSGAVWRISTDEVLKMLWSSYGGVETVHFNVISERQPGGGTAQCVDWSVRVYLRDEQDFEREYAFLTRYTRWLMRGGMEMNIVVLGGRVGGTHEKIRFVGGTEEKIRDK